MIYLSSQLISISNISCSSYISVSFRSNWLDTLFVSIIKNGISKEVIDSSTITTISIGH